VLQIRSVFGPDPDSDLNSSEQTEYKFVVVKCISQPVPHLFLYIFLLIKYFIFTSCLDDIEILLYLLQQVKMYSFWFENEQFSHKKCLKGIFKTSSEYLYITRTGSESRSVCGGDNFGSGSSQVDPNQQRCLEECPRWGNKTHPPYLNFFKGTVSRDIVFILEV
jgi:hypothetical protein